MLARFNYSGGGSRGLKPGRATVSMMYVSSSSALQKPMLSLFESFRLGKQKNV